MWPDRVSNPGSLTYESGVLTIALRGPLGRDKKHLEASEVIETSPVSQILPLC